MKQPDHARILAVDIGGSKLKVLASGQSEPRKAKSGPRLTPSRLVEVVRELTQDWPYDAVSIGYPGLVGESGPSSEPANLGPGWVGFDFAAAFGLPVRITNDAAMQALGSYDGGRMLFLGLGTGVGAALVVPNLLLTLELGSLPYAEGTLAGVLGREGLERLGRKAWRAEVWRIGPALLAAFRADYLVLGGGGAKELGARSLPPGLRLGHNLTAFRGGFRLWHMDDLHTHRSAGSGPPLPEEDWRLL